MDLKTDTEGADLIQRGRAFHKLGAATEKARSPLLSASTLGCLIISGLMTGETKGADVQSINLINKQGLLKSMHCFCISVLLLLLLFRTAMRNLCTIYLHIFHKINQ